VKGGHRGGTGGTGNGDHLVKFKFRCVQVSRIHHRNLVPRDDGGQPASTLFQVTFEPVYYFARRPDATDPPAKFEELPYGKLEISTLSKEAAEHFELGEEYFVTLRRAGKPG